MEDVKGNCAILCRPSVKRESPKMGPSSRPQDNQEEELTANGWGLHTYDACFAKATVRGA